jgi:hypothetical protein
MAAATCNKDQQKEEAEMDDGSHGDVGAAHGVSGTLRPISWDSRVGVFLPRLFLGGGVEPELGDLLNAGHPATSAARKQARTQPS